MRVLLRDLDAESAGEWCGGGMRIYIVVLHSRSMVLVLAITNLCVSPFLFVDLSAAVAMAMHVAETFDE